MSGKAFVALKAFISSKMRMSHVYQPIMLRVLLENRGQASTEEIARAFLEKDRTQLEYYQAIVRNMPGRILSKHRIVERDGKSYKLTPSLSDLTGDERRLLIILCNEALDAYLDKRGLAPWQHRKKSAGYVAGSLRYDIVRRAGGRCEACGVSAEERALEVDHIIPRNKGGSDDRSNLQALCYLCNAQKRDRDDTNYRAVQSSYSQRQLGCAFCDPPGSRLLVSNELAAALKDLFPTTPGHALVVPKRHVSDYFDLHSPERLAVEDLLAQVRCQLKKEDASIDGFNVGVNAGVSAGQTIMHAHIHLIPRRTGDVANPRGGVRAVIPGRQSY